MMKVPRKRKREVVRKLIHLLYGLFFVLLFSITSKLVACIVILAILFSGLLLSELSLRKVELPAVCELLHVCGRDRYLKARPGKGALRFTLGALITRGLFPTKTAVASFLLLTFVDSASALVGSHFGVLGIPWSKRKSIEGSLAGFLVGIAVAAAILPLKTALAAAATAAFVESFDMDDSVTVPLAVGTVVSLL